MNATSQMSPRRRKDAEPPESVVSVTIRFPVSLRRRADVIALAEYRSFASLVLHAVDRYVTEREQQQQQADQDAGK